MQKISKIGLGPILFREETKFLKEIGLSERITVTAQLTTMRNDGSRWTFLHQIYKEDEQKAAEITVDGAWLDLDKRKKSAPRPKKCLPFSNSFPGPPILPGCK
ncbi:MAG: thioesterase family protein [Fodinibius sp.]|nr:thioesterase family protein [Fodinibius sp.]